MAIRTLAGIYVAALALTAAGVANGRAAGGVVEVTSLVPRAAAARITSGNPDIGSCEPIEDCNERACNGNLTPCLNCDADWPQRQCDWTRGTGCQNYSFTGLCGFIATGQRCFLGHCTWGTPTPTGTPCTLQWCCNK